MTLHPEHKPPFSPEDGHDVVLHQPSCLSEHCLHSQVTTQCHSEDLGTPHLETKVSDDAWGRGKQPKPAHCCKFLGTLSGWDGIWAADPPPVLFLMQVGLIPHRRGFSVVFGTSFALWASLDLRGAVSTPRASFPSWQLACRFSRTSDRGRPAQEVHPSFTVPCSKPARWPLNHRGPSWPAA